MFYTGDGCVFYTGEGCTFTTGDECVFETGGCCSFDTANSCEFETGEECVVVRRDIYEVIELVEGQKIKLKGYTIKGYEVIEKEKSIVLDGKKYKLTEIKE